MASKFGKTDIDRIVNVACDLAKTMVDDDDSRVQILQTVCLQCFTTMVAMIGEAITPALPEILGKTLRCLNHSICEDTENKELNCTGFNVIRNVLDHTPGLITGPILEKVLYISFESANAEMGSVCDSARRDMLSSLANQVDIKECLLALTQNWGKAMMEGVQVRRLLQGMRLS